MNCQEAGALFSARVDDELDGHATAEVDAHVAGCAKCRADFERLTALRAAVARACRPVVAPEALRAAVLAGLRATPRVRPGRWQWLLAAPGVAALLLGLWIVLSEPWQPAALPDGSRVVYHVPSADNVDAILRTLRNHLDASPGVRVVRPMEHHHRAADAREGGRVRPLLLLPQHVVPRLFMSAGIERRQR